jgi:predicted O-methyltransferase YrrM
MGKHWSREAVLDVARSFQPACVVAAAADWDVFSALASGPMTASRAASALGADVRAMTVLLDALGAMGLLDKERGEYRVPAGLCDILTESGRETVLPMLQHQANCLRRWAQLSRTVQTGRPPERAPSIRGAEADQAAFIGAMHSISGPLAEGLVAEIQAPPFRHLLDVGGGSGTWTMAFLRAQPDARATIFDLPEVIPMAERRIREAGLVDRVSFVPGDFYTDALPGGADRVWLSAIAHQNSRQQNRALFEKAYRALGGGGTVLIRDVVMNDSHTQPADGALFAINMLVATEGGGTYAYGEFRDDLEAAGFSGVSLIREDAWMNSVIRATKGRES